MDPVIGSIIVAGIGTTGAIVAAVITARSAANVARIMRADDLAAAEAKKAKRKRRRR